MKTTSIIADQITKLIKQGEFNHYINTKGGNKFPPPINSAYKYVRIDHEDGRGYIRVVSNKGSFTVAVKNLTHTGS